MDGYSGVQSLDYKFLSLVNVCGFNYSCGKGTTVISSDNDVVRDGTGIPAAQTHAGGGDADRRTLEPVRGRKAPQAAAGLFREQSHRENNESGHGDL